MLKYKLKRMTRWRYWYVIEAAFVGLVFGAVGFGLFHVAAQISSIIGTASAPSAGYYMAFIVMWAILISSFASCFLSAVVFGGMCWHLLKDVLESVGAWYRRHTR